MKWLTKDDKRLMDFYSDQHEADSKVTNTEVARRAVRYGMFANRTVNAINIRLSKLLAPKEDEEDAETKEPDDMFRIMYEEECEKLDTFLDMVFKNYTVYPNGAAKWNYHDITKAIQYLAPQRVMVETDNALAEMEGANE